MKGGVVVHNNSLHIRIYLGHKSIWAGVVRRKTAELEIQQGRIHGNPVADGWAGAVIRKLLGFQKCDGRTDIPTDLPTD